MSRLIDADALVEKLEAIYHGDISDSELKIYQVLMLLEEQSTAYDVDKVVKQLEHYKNIMKENMDAQADEASYNYYRGRRIAANDAIEIVKAGEINE